MHVGATDVKLSFNAQFPSSVYHNARINISFPQGFGINFEDVVVGVMKNGVPLNGKAIVTMDSNLHIS